MGMIFAGLISAMAFLFLLLKLDIKKVLAFDVWIDLGVTAALAMLFYGTFSGMFAAAVGGAFFSIVLYVIKKTIGYKKLTWRGWQEVPPHI